MTRAGAGPGVQDAVARTIQRLRSQGWDVTSEPGPEQLPQTLADFRPDLLARRGDEHAVVEIRSRRQPPNLDLVTLAERVAALPGWRLDLVYVPEDLTVADRGQLLQWARAAEQLASCKDSDRAGQWPQPEGADRQRQVQKPHHEHRVQRWA